MVLLIVVYMEFALVANSDRPPIMARKMQATIRPYSTAVAPDSSRAIALRESRPANSPAEHPPAASDSRRALQV